MNLALLNEVLKDVIEIDNPRDLFEYYLERGDELPILSMKHRTKDFLIPGCVSEVFLAAQLDQDNKLLFRGWAEALTVRGYLAILLNALSGLTAQEILDSESQVIHFLENSRLQESVVGSRANAAGNIFLRIKEVAKNIIENNISYKSVDKSGNNLINL